MIPNGEQTHRGFEQRVAEKYARQGFDVTIEPNRNELPFELGNYRPDIVAIKSPEEGYIIEVKSGVSQMPIDRYREIAETISEHPGWRFLLVTEEDVSTTREGNRQENLLTWDQMLERQSQADKLISAGETEAAFLVLWGVLEAAARRHAQEVSIPIERLPSTTLIKHLYSQGELTMEQFDLATMLQDTRNRIAHGYQAAGLGDAVIQLQQLVHQVLSEWVPESAKLIES